MVFCLLLASLKPYDSSSSQGSPTVRGNILYPGFPALVLQGRKNLSFRCWYAAEQGLVKEIPPESHGNAVPSLVML